MEVLILGVIHYYMVSASFSCFFLHGPYKLQLIHPKLLVYVFIQ